MTVRSVGDNSTASGSITRTSAGIAASFSAPGAITVVAATAQTTRMSKRVAAPLTGRPGAGRREGVEREMTAGEMTDNQKQRLSELESYARQMKQSAEEKEQREPWVNVLAWIILIRDDQ